MALNNGHFEVKMFWFQIICNFLKILKPDYNASVHHVTMLKMITERNWENHEIQTP